MHAKAQALGHLLQGLARLAFAVGRKNHPQQGCLVFKHGKVGHMVVGFEQKAEQPRVLWRNAHQQAAAARGRRQGRGRFAPLAQ